MHAFRNSLRDVFAHWKTGMLAFRLRRTGDDVAEQKKVLDELLEGFSRADFGKAHKLLPGISYSQFRERVRPQGHAALSPLIDQVVEGVPDVLWPGTCKRFVKIKTLPGEPQRLLPVTGDIVEHFQRAWRRSLLQLAVRGAPVSTLRARQWWLGASATLKPLGEAAQSRTVGELPDVLVASLREDHVLEFQSKIQAADRQNTPAPELGSDEPSLVVLKYPSQLSLFLASEGKVFLSQAKRSVILIGPHHSILTELSPSLMPGETILHEVFACEAGIIAAQEGDPELGLRLLTNTGLFLEFIPLPDYDAARIADLGSKVIPLGDVKTGVDYVVLVTSPAGLCRYATGELIRFVSTAPYRIHRMGHVNRLLNVLGERVNERQISECLQATCLPHKWNIVHFHVAPIILSSLTGSVRAHHEWWVELRPGTRETPTGKLLAEKLDKALQAQNPDYAQRRKAGTLDAPVVRLLMPGVFEQWFMQNGLSEDRFLIPPCLPNRPIADALAKLARFYD